ncbi:MAG: DUF5320 domain-containing protein [Bacteroidetes bacterium]|nr:DUF5320 domain-containing protein [Bacteroidota bacterium]
MPSGDRTGPMGQGPMTGRALGFCTGNDTPGYTIGFGGGRGRGFGYGRRGGRGMDYRGGRNYNRPDTRFMQGYPSSLDLNRDDEIKILKAQADELKRAQKDLEKRISELEKADE